MILVLLEGLEHTPPFHYKNLHFPYRGKFHYCLPRFQNSDLLNSIDWKCDVVLSHTCPKIYMPTDLFLPFIDQSTVDNSMEEYLGGIEFKLQYKLWVWGHYHHYRVYPLEDGKQKLMLFNDKAIELQEWMNGSLKSYNCFKG